MIEGRPRSVAGPDAGRTEIVGRRRVHCSYHKCLTVYFEKVLKRMVRTPIGLRGGYRHFNSHLDAFYRDCEEYAVASVNNHVLDLDRFEDVRVTRFVRDPRDLIVSGYFFHKRSRESWCEVVGPRDADWEVVRGAVPDSLTRRGKRESYRAYLHEVSLEEGLLAELAFRRHHFESMRAWPKADPRVELFRYEDVLGREVEVFDRIFQFYGLPYVTRRIGLHYAHRFRAESFSDRSDHIRDPKMGQWREVFTPEVTRRFDAEYGDLIEFLGYSRA